MSGIKSDQRETNIRSDSQVSYITFISSSLRWREAASAFEHWTDGDAEDVHVNVSDPQKHKRQ